MRRVAEMHSPQPSITSQEEYHGYLAAAERLRRMMLPHEQDLWHMSHKAPIDQAKVDAIRGHLAHLYRIFQDIHEQIRVYEANGVKWQ